MKKKKRQIKIYKNLLKDEQVCYLAINSTERHKIKKQSTIFALQYIC